jgi:hypothetical protein
VTGSTLGILHRIAAQAAQRGRPVREEGDDDGASAFLAGDVIEAVVHAFLVATARGNTNSIYLALPPPFHKRSGSGAAY